MRHCLIPPQPYALANYAAQYVIKVLRLTIGSINPGNPGGWPHVATTVTTNIDFPNRLVLR